MASRRTQAAARAAHLLGFIFIPPLNPVSERRKIRGKASLV
jgi:hypothetical protein